MSDAALTTLVSGIITVTTTLVGFLTLWLKLRYGIEKVEEAAIKAKEVEKKIDTNTTITEVAAASAISNAKIAVDTAIETKITTDYIAKQLNGNFEDKIILIVKSQTEPMLAMMKAHSDQDDKNMQEIRNALGELRDQIRGRHN